MEIPKFVVEVKDKVMPLSILGEVPSLSTAVVHLANRILELTNNHSTQAPNSSSHADTSDSSVVSHDELDSLSGSDGNCSDSNGDDPSNPHRRYTNSNDSYSLQWLIDELKTIN